MMTDAREIGEAGLGRRALEAIVETPGAGLRLRGARTDRILGFLPLLREIHAMGGVAVEVALATLSPRLATWLEPGADPPLRRLHVVRALARAGIAVGVRIAPIAPRLNDGLGDLRRLVGAAAAAGATTLTAAVLRLDPDVRRRLFARLREERPALVARYLGRYGTGPAPPREYEIRVLRVVDALRREAGLAHGPPDPVPAPQLRLPFGGLARGLRNAVASKETVATETVATGT